MLLEQLIVESRQRGFRQLVAVIGDGSASSPSVRLHERLGFRHSGVLQGSGYKHDRWLDTTFMQLSMNGAILLALTGNRCRRGNSGARLSEHTKRLRKAAVLLKRRADFPID